MVKPPRLVLPDSKTEPKIIWLNSQALELLAGFQRGQDDALVFVNSRGKHPVNIEPWWYNLRRRCAMPDLRVHDLRHSFASTAIMDSVPLATIGKLLGHVLPETTAKYAHLSEDVIGDFLEEYWPRWSQPRRRLHGCIHRRGQRITCDQVVC